MSVWTHVAGVIRIDHFCKIKDETFFESILGKQIHDDSSDEDWDAAEKNPESFVPYGSEGGIRYTVLTYSDEGLPSYVITIFGDLRDYYDTYAIEKWFNNILYHKRLLIHDAVLSIDCEIDEEKTVIVYKDEEKTLEI